MRLLAIDQGTVTGWAAQANGELYYGTQDFSPKRGESAGMRFLRFGGWLWEMNDLVGGIEAIIHEQPHHRGGAAAQVALGLTAKIQEFAARHDCEVTSVHSTRLKKWATGKGNASKDDMIARCKELGHDPKNDDEADALLMLFYFLDRLGETYAAEESIRNSKKKPPAVGVNSGNKNRGL